MAVHKIFRTYRFIDKDPVIDELRTLLQDEGLFDQLAKVAVLANLSYSTVYSLFHGETRRPHNSTASSIGTCAGYERGWKKVRRNINWDEELKLAIAWNKKERKRMEALRAKEKSHKKKAV